jgi:putative N-acetylmannosamine-6-phosphate epimerase
VFAEGRFWTREDAKRALDLGASFVVVGTAITNPVEITRRFVSFMKQDAT